jgi:RNA polymerase sigma-70 factor (ECF subfamily)
MSGGRLLQLVSVDQGPDDATLVERSRAGDQRAEEALYRRHAPYVYSVVARMLGRTQDAEDVLQDAFVTALEKLAQLADPAAFRAWLLRSAVHQAHRQFRRRRLLRRLGFARDDDAVSLTPGSGASPEQRAMIAELEEALTRIPPGPRLCWMLRYVEGCTLDEVASAAGCSLATAKRRLAAARAALDDCVENDWGDAG